MNYKSRLRMLCSAFWFPPASVLSLQPLIGLRNPGYLLLLVCECWGFSTNIIMMVMVRPSCRVDIYHWDFLLRPWGCIFSQRFTWRGTFNWRGYFILDNFNLNGRGLLPVHIISGLKEGPEPHIAFVVLLRHPLEIYDSLGAGYNIWTVGHWVVAGVTAVQVSWGWWGLAVSEW